MYLIYHQGHYQFLYNTVYCYIYKYIIIIMCLYTLDILDSHIIPSNVVLNGQLEHVKMSSSFTLHVASESQGSIVEQLPNNI